jgi:ferredoxin
MDIQIDVLKCTGCGTCTYLCPVGALSVVDTKCRVGEGCISCGNCLEMCSFKAITVDDPIMKKRTGKKRGN